MCVDVLNDCYDRSLSVAFGGYCLRFGSVVFVEIPILVLDVLLIDEFKKR